MLAVPVAVLTLALAVLMVQGLDAAAWVIAPLFFLALFPAFEATLNAVTRTLTNEELQKMNAAVDIEKKKPADVARSYLQAQGLL